MEKNEGNSAAPATGASLTTERDLLNCALELFYDDFAATIGLVLEDDEVARLEALNLIPRRTEQKTRRAAAGGAAASGALASG